MTKQEKLFKQQHLELIRNSIALGCRVNKAKCYCRT